MERLMTYLRLKLFLIISMLSLSLGLTSCVTTPTTSTDTHPENVYEGGFGGDGGHVHRS